MAIDFYFWNYFLLEYNYNAVLGSAAKSLQSCPTLCDLIDGSPPGSPIPGILQARTLEWVAISFSNAWKWSAQSCPTLRDPMDCSLPGSSIHGIFQARVLEWGAIAFSSARFYCRAKWISHTYAYIYSLTLGFSSHSGHCSAVSRVPCAT